MLVSENIIEAINEQVGKEFEASLQYEAISAHFAAESLPHLSRHFAKQAEEEREHAHRFMRFVIDAGGRVKIPGIAAPQCSFESAREAVRLSLEREIAVTSLINRIVDLALKENDHITNNFLQWFLKEQLEEVSSMDQLLKIVERAGESNLLLVEQLLAEEKEKLLRAKIEDEEEEDEE
ncbi:ferritin [Candidatus Methylacidithermus pantelleriae]|uniref:Ferritin n=1 Tax=Candidatus Methylacidithermus pantelleriae TaxID=2744239 RepID=A0A8J2BLP9_9BACT|nr:ferritin [Candidatus Methylacidithermus pantelleriae]CAF0689429.1 Ferritin BfrB [Candidatus Methylacidithermus pantelleriae]